MIVGRSRHDVAGGVHDVKIVVVARSAQRVRPKQQGGLARTVIRVVFEGAEGAGKTTQIRLLLERLAADGIVAAAFREPGGTPVGDSIRAIGIWIALGEWAFRSRVDCSTPGV